MKRTCLTLLVCLSALAAGLLVPGAFAQSAKGEPVEVKDKEHIETYVDADGRDQFGFSVIGGENQSPQLTVEVMPREGGSGLLWLGIVLSVLAAGAAAFGLLVKGRRRRTLRIISLAATAVFLGGGVFGFVYKTEGGYAPYRYVNAVATEAPAPDAVRGLSTASIQTRRILSDFEFGLENRYDRIYNHFKHYWTEKYPAYSYERAEAGEEFTAFAATEGETDNSNYWYVLPGKNGAKGTVTATYRLDYSGYGNFVDTRLYDKFRIVFSAENPDSRDVNLTVKLMTSVPSGFHTYTLGTYEGRSKDKVVLTFQTNVLPADERASVARIVFETDNGDVGGRADGRSYQKNSLYYAEFCSSVTPKLVQELDGIVYSSEYYGTMVPTRFGLYSGSAMYDTEARLWRWWGGGGMSEGVASDNIWYLETEDPALGWTKQQRIVIDDPDGVLHAYNMAPGQGGDPSVLKIDGTYYMYFTGLPKDTVDGRWNKVMLATSTDGIRFQLVNEPIVDVPANDNLYGAGAPSLIYKDEMFYMYYFDTTASGGMYATSTDGVRFESPRPIKRNTAGGPADVTYVPSIDKWVLYDGQLAFSEGSDGVNFTYPTDTIAQVYDGLAQPAQNFSVYVADDGLRSARLNHSGNFIENEHGVGFDTMFICYAYEDLQDTINGLNMDFRELEWSRITFSKAV